MVTLQGRIVDGVVVSTQHALNIVIRGAAFNELKPLTEGAGSAIIADDERKIVYIAGLRVTRSSIYIRIPLAYMQLYRRGEKASVFVIPIPFWLRRRLIPTRQEKVKAQ